jgi:hypothetical protein
MPNSNNDAASDLAAYVRFARMARNERDAALRARWDAIARDHLRRAAKVDPATVARVSATLLRKADSEPGAASSRRPAGTARQ